MMLRTAAIFAVAWAALIAILKSNHAESGCRMAFMNPKYIPHNHVQSKHSDTYGLYLYRDRRWNVLDSVTVGSNRPYLLFTNALLKPDGVPVLFIPGNAGSYKQARSIAAELSKQYYTDYDQPNSYLMSQHIPLPDLWTGEYGFPVIYSR